MLTLIFGEQCSLDQRLSAFFGKKSGDIGMAQAVAEIRVAIRMSSEIFYSKGISYRISFFRQKNK
jgi:hypothetical protein